MKKRLSLLGLILLTGSVLVGQNIGPTGSYAWRVPIDNDVSFGDGRCVSGGEMIVNVRMENGVLQKVRLANANCPGQRIDKDVQWVQLDPAASIAFLEKHRGQEVVTAIALHDHPNAIPALERLAKPGESDKTREQALFWLGQRGGERGFQLLKSFVHSNENTSLRKKAVFALSQSESAGAIPELIQLARHDASSQIRREALFWLGQKAGERAAGELRRAVDEDPDDDVREHAVFAISQLPPERAVPLLSDLARNHKSAAVRKKAIFWLTQTGDERALDVIQDILGQ